MVDVAGLVGGQLADFAESQLGYGQGSLPETERAARETLALPIWPAISREQQERVVECLRAASTVKAA